MRSLGRLQIGNVYDEERKVKGEVVSKVEGHSAKGHAVRKVDWDHIF